VPILGSSGPASASFASPPSCSSPTPRKALLCEIAAKLRAATVPPDTATTILERVGAAADGKPLAKVRDQIAAICKGEARPIVDPAKPATFQQVAERWTSGELARAYPDQVKVKSTAERDRQRLEHYVYPIVGATPIARFTLDDAEAVMRSLPSGCTTHARPSSRSRWPTGKRRAGSQTARGIARAT